jgi:tetratricopeptide (TPR) repeat protein
MDNSTPNNADFLVRYLDGELTETEKENLEKRLSEDPALKLELENLEITREAILQYGLKQKVAGIHQEMMKEIRTPVRKMSSTRRILRYSIAAAASIILVIGGFLLYNFVTLSSEKIFASRYQVYELSNTRSTGTNERPIEKAYREKNYAEVKRIHNSGEDNSPKAEFLNGMAFLETKPLANAINSFNELLELNKQSENPVLNDEAEYYLALTYIRNRDYDLALTLLQKIREDSSHLYHAKVTPKLIRQVRTLKWR